MTDVAVVGFAQSPTAAHSDSTTSSAEMLVPIFQQVLADAGLAKDGIGHATSGPVLQQNLVCVMEARP